MPLPLFGREMFLPGGEHILNFWAGCVGLNGFVKKPRRYMQL